jgi:hypothetical protein
MKSKNRIVNQDPIYKLRRTPQSRPHVRCQGTISPYLPRLEAISSLSLIPYHITWIQKIEHEQGKDGSSSSRCIFPEFTISNKEHLDAFI